MEWMRFRPSRQHLKEYARCSMRSASRSLGVECSPTTRAFQGPFQLARDLNFRRDLSAWLIVNSIVTCISWNEDTRSKGKQIKRACVEYPASLVRFSGGGASHKKCLLCKLPGRRHRNSLGTPHLHSDLMVARPVSGTTKLFKFFKSSMGS